MADRWIIRWKVPSESDPDKTYIVARDAEGEYGCSCPVWKFRRQECKHIRAVKDGEYNPVGEDPKVEPEIVFANVREVMPETRDGVIRLLTPLVKIGDMHFQATVIYDLLANGVRWTTCKWYYKLAKANSKKAIVAYVEERGRCVYGPEFIKGRGYVGYEIVPVIKERTS
jgi:hypothetical protein